MHVAKKMAIPIKILPSKLKLQKGFL